MTRFAYGFATLILALAAPIQATAQNWVIEREGDGDVFIDHRIDRMLRRGQYVAYVEETRTIAAGETIASDVLVLGGELYLEGTVQGDVLGVDADIYLRPGAVVEGDLVNVGAGVYRSELAEVRRRYRSLPNLPYEVRRSGQRVLIVSREERRALALDGPFGLGSTEYNRVDGFHPRFGFTYTARPFLAGFAPGARGRLGFRTEPGEVTGGGSLFLEREGFGIEAGWMRDTRSQDRWIRSDIRNSADFLLDGDDMRNYYDSDVAFAEARYRFGDEAAERYVTVGVRYEQEDASSMRRHNPYNIFGDDTLRTNPPIDEGTINSFIPFVRGEWVTRSTATDAFVSIEHAPDGGDPCLDPNVCDDSPEFTRLRVNSEFAMQAIANHTLEIELQFMMPLAGEEPLPRQRWGMLGGSGTIRTVDDAAFYGDHLAYSETEYEIPLGFIRLPRNVVPTFELLHMAGLAWTGERDEGEDIVQNVGARLNVWALYARFLIDPASGDQELTAGFSWPFDSKYPWQE